MKQDAERESPREQAVRLIADALEEMDGCDLRLQAKAIMAILRANGWHR